MPVEFTRASSPVLKILRPRGFPTVAGEGQCALAARASPTRSLFEQVQGMSSRWSTSPVCIRLFVSLRHLIRGGFHWRRAVDQGGHDQGPRRWDGWSPRPRRVRSTPPPTRPGTRRWLTASASGTSCARPRARRRPHPGHAPCPPCWSARKSGPTPTPGAKGHRSRPTPCRCRSASEHPSGEPTPVPSSRPRPSASCLDE